jgi:hypothetical protein
MIEQYFVPATKITSKVADLVVPGNSIAIDNYHYERLSRRPKGRSIIRTLLSIDSKERLVIYA